MLHADTLLWFVSALLHPVHLKVLVPSSFAKQMAARSVAVTFHNETDSALIHTSNSIPHGIWNTEPPARIEKDQVVGFSSESSGVGTGQKRASHIRVNSLQPV